jgi:HPt (histidine-containing phosphotransfer) domain-containing protein
MNDLHDPGFLHLQRQYLAAFPALLGELEQGIAAFRAGSEDAPVQLTAKFHQLAGSGGAYGFPEVSVLAREAEQSLIARPAGLDADYLDRVVAELGAAFRQAQAAR